MPDFDAAIAKTIEAQRKITEAARAASDELAAQRTNQGASEPITSLPPATGS